MSSLLLYASPLDDNNIIMSEGHNGKKNDNTIINKKRNKTQRNLNKNDDVYYNNKLSNLINAIHNNPQNDDDELLHNYSPIKPLNPPESVGVQNTIIKEQQTDSSQNNQNERNYQNYQNYQNNSSYNTINGVDENITEDYFQKILPNVPLTETNDYTNNYTNTGYKNGNSVLVEKLNYLIHLLEEKQDEKTGNVLEEIILYSFLGIFIIFVIDSFVKIGRYTR